MKKILIYDKEKTGHHAEFLSHIVQYWCSTAHNKKNSYILIVHEKIALDLTLLASIPTIIVEKINPETLFSKKNESHEQVEWEYLKNKVEEHRCSDLFLMYLDPYKYRIGKEKNLSVHISGIFFAPTYRLETTTKTLKNYAYVKLKTLRNDLRLYWLLRNKQLHKLFILNDEEAVAFYNKKFKQNCFTYLTDPTWNTPTQVPNNKLLEAHNISEKDSVFLTLGGIDERKNLYNILSAMAKITDKKLPKTHYFICGKFYSDQHFEAIQILATKINTENSTFKIIIQNRFLSEEEVEEMLSITNLVLIPYQDTFVSSGLVGHAARYNIPCLYPNYGLVRYLGQKYNLGIMTDPTDIEAIKTSFLSYFCTNSTINGEIYVKSHTSKEFSQTIFTSI
jgi:glycosyltransferase involved in cell wall biosynthesis